MTMVIDGSGGVTFPDNSIQASAVQTVLVTSSVDIPMTALLGTSQQNVGSSFSVNIPANGFIRLANLSGRFLNSASATSHRYSLGIRIGTTNYWFNQQNSNGTFLIGASAAVVDCPNVASGFYEVYGQQFITSTGVGVYFGSLDVAGLSIPTGTQTVQLITAYIVTAGTIKGTVKQTRVVLEFIGV